MFTEHLDHPEYPPLLTLQLVIES